MSKTIWTNRLCKKAGVKNVSCNAWSNKNVEREFHDTPYSIFKAENQNVRQSKIAPLGLEFHAKCSSSNIQGDLSCCPIVHQLWLACCSSPYRSQATTTTTLARSTMLATKATGGLLRLLVLLKLTTWTRIQATSTRRITIIRGTASLSAVSPSSCPFPCSILSPHKTIEKP